LRVVGAVPVVVASRVVGALPVVGAVVLRAVAPFVEEPSTFDDVSTGRVVAPGAIVEFAGFAG